VKKLKRWKKGIIRGMGQRYKGIKAKRIRHKWKEQLPEFPKITSTTIQYATFTT
jgi:hypothetical protein